MITSHKIYEAVKFKHLKWNLGSGGLCNTAAGGQLVSRYCGTKLNFVDASVSHAPICGKSIDVIEWWRVSAFIPELGLVSELGLGKTGVGGKVPTLTSTLSVFGVGFQNWTFGWDPFDVSWFILEADKKLFQNRYG